MKAVEGASAPRRADENPGTESLGSWRHPDRDLTAAHADLLRLWFWSRGRDERPQAVFSHQTALALYDLAEFIPSAIHMTVPKAFRKRPPTGCILHKASLEKSEWRDHDVFRVTTPRRTLEDLAGDPAMPREQFEHAVKNATARGLIRRSESIQLLSEHGPARRATRIGAQA